MRLFARRCLFLFLIAVTAPAFSQQCLTGDDIDAGARSNLQNTAQQFFRMSAAGDYAGLKNSSIPAVANNFGSIETAAAQNKENFEGAQATVRSVYVLEAPGTAPYPRAEFFCGVYNSPDRTEIVLPKLDPGRYALVIEDASGGKVPMTLTLVFKQIGLAWKLAGFYLRPKQIAGHNGQWYLAQARQFKSRGDSYAAWFYFLSAWDTVAPVDFMSTPELDKINEELQQSRPAELPSPSKPLLLAANGRTVHITSMTADPQNNGLQLVVRYQVPDITDVDSARNQNLTVARALISKYPGFRDAFTQIVAYAVDPQGRAFWSPLPTKDVR